MTNDVLVETFNRIQAVVHSTIEGLSPAQLAKRPGDSANSIAWLVWHLSRVQDDHIADAAAREQVWIADSWFEKFGLPFRAEETGYGHNSSEVALVQIGADLLREYYDAVHAVTIDFIKTLKSQDYKRIVDDSWDPPVTLAVRLVSVISDDLQHAGQAAYVRGLIT